MWSTCPPSPLLYYEIWSDLSHINARSGMQYSNTVLTVLYNFEVLYLHIFILYYFVLLLQYKSERKIKFKQTDPVWLFLWIMQFEWVGFSVLLMQSLNCYATNMETGTLLQCTLSYLSLVQSNYTFPALKHLLAVWPRWHNWRMCPLFHIPGMTSVLLEWVKHRLNLHTFPFSASFAHDVIHLNIPNS